ncbi:hypothetical protein Salat_1739700 [Sesamum alatum]|uniref:Uncharacterized protein n=1 Tax=Sesamum alatum TaxID=300844 RepID=A0AAE1Y8T6_9LAMI|nr:hypothetical protein Salat_1739700 [Sesamum alatum]
MVWRDLLHISYCTTKGAIKDKASNMNTTEILAASPMPVNRENDLSDSVPDLETIGETDDEGLDAAMVDNACWLKHWNKVASGDVFTNIRTAEAAVALVERVYNADPSDSNLMEMNHHPVLLQHAVTV